MTSERASVSTVAGAGRAREQAALEAREVLAHGVELADRRAGGQQQLRHRLLVLERHRRRRGGRECRAAAGDEHDDEVVGAGRFGQRQQPRGRGHAAGVGNGMAGLGQLDRARWASDGRP